LALRSEKLLALFTIAFLP